MTTNGEDRDLLAHLYGDPDVASAPNEAADPGLDDEARARLDAWSAVRTRVGEADDAEEMRPAFRARLRSEVMTEAARPRGARAWRRWLLGPGSVWASAAAVAAAVLLVVSGPEPRSESEPERVPATAGREGPPAPAGELAADASPGEEGRKGAGSTKEDDPPGSLARLRAEGRGAGARAESNRRSESPPRQVPPEPKVGRRARRTSSDAAPDRAPARSRPESPPLDGARGVPPPGTNRAAAPEDLAALDAAEVAEGSADRAAAPSTPAASSVPARRPEPALPAPVRAALRTADRAVAAERWADAERAFDRAEARSETPRERRWVWVARAEAALRSDRPREAARWAQRAMLDADDAVAQRARGVLERALRRQGSPRSPGEANPPATTRERAAD